MTASTAPDLQTLDLQRRLARRQARMQAWRRRSRLIHRLRYILPATVAGVVVLLLGWVLVKGLLSRIGDLHGGGASIHMTNARFYGRDGQGQAFVLGAAEASRGNADLKLISLVSPMLEFNADALKPSRITADRGSYREDTRILRLDHHVVLVDSTGYTFRTEEAIVDTVNVTVTGWTGVRGSGPSGTITANSYGVYDRGRRVVFKGEVHSILKTN